MPCFSAVAARAGLAIEVLSVAIDRHLATRDHIVPQHTDQLPFLLRDGLLQRDRRDFLAIDLSNRCA